MKVNHKMGTVTTIKNTKEKVWRAKKASVTYFKSRAPNFANITLREALAAANSLIEKMERDKK